MYFVEFYHGYFGWLKMDERFETREEAAAWVKNNPTTYRQRVRKEEALQWPSNS